MGKFWNGVSRDGGKELDKLKYRCCSADYHEPLKGEVPLPDAFKGKEGHFSFKTPEGNFLRMNDNTVDLKSTGRGAWEQFRVKPDDIKKGLYRVINHQLREMGCEGAFSNTLTSANGDGRLK